MRGQQYTGSSTSPLTLVLSLRERGYIDAIDED
jgi:hypothetical protein